MMLQSLRDAQYQILKLMREKVITDAIDDTEGTLRQSLDEFVEDYFLRKYGLRKLSLRHLMLFIHSCMGLAHKSDRIQVSLVAL